MKVLPTGAGAAVACEPVAARCAPLMLAMSAAFSPSGFAQDAVPATGVSARLPLTIVPSFSAQQTYTRNDATTPGDARSQMVTQLSPGVTVSSEAGRVRGYLNYALNTLTYAKDSGQNTVQQSLNASVNAEVIQNFAYVDTSANISQQSISAFGQQFNDNTVVSANRTEVLTYSVSPSFRGSLAGVVDYDARLSYTKAHSKATSDADNANMSASLRVGGNIVTSALNWSLSATRQRLEVAAGQQSSESTRADAGLNYAVSPELNVNVRAGRESSDFGSIDKRSATTSGVGFGWQPTPATSLSGDFGHRAFGNTHSLSLMHRTGRTVWTYSDSRGVSNGVGQPIQASLGTAFDLFYQLFASRQPDPALRTQEVIAFLRTNGIDPTGQVIGSFLTRFLTVDRRQALSVALEGVRDTVTLIYSRSEASRLDGLVGVGDDFSSIRQQGLSLGLAHRLTPTSTVNVGASQQRSSGVATVARSSRLSSIDVAWSEQLGRRTRLSVSARRSVFSSAISPYTDTALTAGVTITF